MPKALAFRIDKKYQALLEAFQCALGSELMPIQKNQWLNYIHEQKGNSRSYFSASQLKSRDMTWTTLLYAGIKLHDYVNTLDDSDEKLLLNDILDLLVKLWNETTAFSESHQQDLQQKLSAWLEITSHHGENKALCDFLFAYCLLTLSLQDVLTSLGWAEKTLFKSILPLFESLIQLSPNAETAYRRILKEYPMLNQAEKPKLTHENAGNAMRLTCIKMLKELEASENKLISTATDIEKQLPLLNELLAISRTENKQSIGDFFKKLSSEDALLSYLNALNIPKSQHQAWIATFNSYHAPGFSNHMSYLWGGVAVTQQTLQQHASNAIEAFASSLKIELTKDSATPEEKISLLQAAIAKRSYLEELHRKHSHLTKLKDTSRNFNFSLPIFSIKKRSRFQILPSDKTVIKNKLLEICDELNDIHKQYTLALKSFASWRKQSCELLSLIHDSFVEEHQRVLLVEHYRQGIHSAFLAYYSEDSSADAGIHLLDIIISDLSLKVQRSQQNANMFMALHRTVDNLDLSFLQYIACFMAVIDEKSLVSLSMSFIRARAIIFNCIAEAWSEEKQTFQNIDTVFQHISQSFKRKNSNERPLSLEKMSFFAEKLSAHNQEQTIAQRPAP